ncbi:hypothetical protein [Streptosporangium roseum]|uniref:ATP-dependent DNA helicase RecG n=1 Tax=Streptosporangium roseum (strain ATCC 12428 / DSM 43021 / JCM 3005 / KCTC 9067 / NCIMB 10171 / NRRL 2505 / NI 9100) TaxID=479432 RepID=D2B3L7_STRRD|nr:hypothetical protein [Streptosporangium roseum]ACZ89302.1 conserved hypothetical protein [Streptosporangium roseum DSM 43021]
MRLRTVVAALVLLAATSTTAAPVWAGPDPAAGHAAPAPSPPGGCDPIAGAECLLPFPNDWFTTDARTRTGLRVNLSAEAMPRNAAGAPIDPAQWNAADGFSPGSMLLAHVPGLDLARTGAAPVTDIGWSLRRDAPIVIVDTRTGERWPYWAELDAGAADPARQALIIRPAKNFQEGHRYAVALRGLKNAAGEDLPAPETFTRLLADDLPAGDPLAGRQHALHRTLGDLSRAGVDARGLQLAWDFTVASEQGIAGPVLTMRDRALRALRGRSPKFTVTSVTDLAPEQDPDIAREVAGEILVPNYLDKPGGPPGSNLNRGPDGLPRPLGDTAKAQYQCEIPRSAFRRPAHPSLYGHGLLGKATEVRARNVRAMAGEHGFVFCATKWIGMSDEDVQHVASVFGDLSRFGTVTDRLQQSLLNFVLLGRAMITRDGFAGHAAFQDGRGRSLIDLRADLAYDGNSQGAITGGALVAVSPDVRNAVLGVPGMNYSTLLNRSVDFQPFQRLMDGAYPDRMTQQICFALMQMLWDRAETDGYAQHLTDDPLAGSPRHRVLLHVAFGDHQVSTVTAEVEARTVGARIRQPGLAAGRGPDLVPYWGLRSMPRRPYAGSALVVWDSGAPAPPVTNTPPLGPQYGRDPHEDPRHDRAARVQKAHFLRDGLVVDVCGDAPCVAGPVEHR